MKKAVIVRHAKSSWANLDLKDIDRPLNTRGLHDGPKMAKLLHKHIDSLDNIFTSPAVRARSTALFFAESYGISEDEMKIFPEMYYGSEEELLETVQLAPDEADNIALFSHNPKITHFVNLFTKNYIDNVPTCGISILVADIKSWKEFNERTAELYTVLFPKLVL